MSSSGTGVAASVASLSQWSLDMPTDRVETTSMLDLNKTYVQGLRDIKGSMTGFWEDSQDALFDASESTDGVKVYLYPSNLAPTVYFYGPAWVDASINVSVNGAVGLTASFAANGQWARKP